MAIYILADVKRTRFSSVISILVDGMRAYVSLAIYILADVKGTCVLLVVAADETYVSCILVDADMTYAFLVQYFLSIAGIV
jgi:hypothetical protein